MKKFSASTLILFASIAIIGSIFFAACGPQSADVQSDGKITIAVIPKGTAHIFWQSVYAGALTAAKEFDVEISWMGPQSETMKEQQISIVEDFITKRVDGMVLAPQSQDALVPVVEKVALAKIPCAIFDSGINTEQYLTFVATDNYSGGVKAAHEMARLLNNKGTCIIVRVDPGSESTNQREKGFEDTLAENYPDIKIIDAQYGYSDREKSRAVTEDMLTAHPDVDAIYGPNESSTFGALLALQARQLAGKKVFVGFDSSDELIDALQKKEIQALILQNPFNMGYQGVKAVVQHLNGEEVDKRIDTGVYLITPDNMNDPDNKLLLKPDLSILSE
ncbi:MAG: substrate-binding domain-containing protein [Candidatus Hinthialibacter antarcticus]|nr:substrate-binding domain-containing protein [Candidatus Hinthialibacter antarcticus]